jgi:hypothetical protein
MSITYKIELSKDIVYVRWVGRITANDMIEFFTTFYADPDTAKCSLNLVDVREADVAFSTEEFEEIINEIVIPQTDRYPNLKVAILVSTPLQYGVSRQYQFFSDTFGKDAIFTDEQSALQWLGL